VDSFEATQFFFLYIIEMGETMNSPPPINNTRLIICAILRDDIVLKEIKKLDILVINLTISDKID